MPTAYSVDLRVRILHDYFQRQMRMLSYCLLIFPISWLAFGVPPDIEKQIESAFGIVERNEQGTIIGVDLARERSSANDDVLQAALSIPNLKRFRFAGKVSAESLSGLKQQRELEDLYLQDVPIRDADWRQLLEGHTRLIRLTMRRLPNLSGEELGMLPQRIPALRNLALIEMELQKESLSEIARSEVLAALDVRNCSRLTAANFRCLTSMPKLTDLKIGGFGITDEVLTAIAPLRLLRGLTIDDAVITPKGWNDFTTAFASAEKLETLVFSRNSALFDDALVSLKKFTNLKRLTVNGMMLTGSFLEQLSAEESVRPKLQRLSLRKTFLSEEGANALKKFPELRILDLSGNALSPKVIETITALTRLEELDVSDCGLDEETLQRIKAMPGLKRLNK